jgi:hypothetical protein
VELEATKVESGDNFVVILDELENGDLFYVIFCNKPLHMCEETFADEWGNIWYEGEMMFKRVWYYRVVGQQGENFSYRLLVDAALSFVYSHHVVASKFLMFPTTKRKGNPRFFMAIENRVRLLVVVEKKANY